MKASRFADKMLYQGYDARGRLVYEEMVGIHKHYDDIHKWDRDEFWKLSKMRTLRFTRFDAFGRVEMIEENRRSGFSYKNQKLVTLFGK